MMKYIVIYILNLIDYAMTVYWTGLNGIAHEVNPIMRWALSTPSVFTLTKVFLVPVFLYWMWRKKRDDTAWIALGAFLAVVWMNLNTIFL